MARLAEGGWIESQAAEDLGQAYLFLRRVENRLQMVGDQQTHIIPDDKNELDRVAPGARGEVGDQDARQRAGGRCGLRESRRVAAHQQQRVAARPERGRDGAADAAARPGEHGTVAHWRQRHDGSVLKISP